MPFNLDDYEPVEDRLRMFWQANPGGRVETDLVRDDDVLVFKAAVFKVHYLPSDGQANTHPDATGYAHQHILTEPPKKRNGEPNYDAPEWTSPYEVAETSAIGRALANLGYQAKRRPSREEMSKTSGEAAAESGTGRRGISPSPTSSSPAAGPAASPTAAAGEATTANASADAAGDPYSPTANGEVSSATEPGEAQPFSPSPGSTIDAPGPPHYALDPSACDHHRTTGSRGLLSPRKSPRGPVCPRCGLSYITVTEGTSADLGSAT